MNKTESITRKIGNTHVSLKKTVGDLSQQTAVTLGAHSFCWIHWEKKDDFIAEINEVIRKYRI